MFNFTEPAILTADKEYEIRFELSNGYPDNCGIENIKYENVSLSDVVQSRRRLSGEAVKYDELMATANPNSCVLSARLAQSDSMKTAVSAMCQENNFNTKPSIEAGLFQQHARFDFISIFS